MLKAISAAVATLWATQALAGSFPSPTLYPSFSNAHERGTFTTFKITGAKIVDPVAINASGVVVGTYWFGDSIWGGFLRTPDGQITTFEAPGAGLTHPGNGTQAFGINSAGDIVGTFTRNNISHGYLRLANGTFIAFDPPKSNNTVTTGINTDDTVTGNYTKKGRQGAFGFVRTSDGTITTFNVGSRSIRSVLPDAINDAGSIIGTFFAADGNVQGFVRTPAGVSKKFDFRGSQNLVKPAAINNAGTIAGYFYNSANVTGGFLRAPNGQLTRFKVPGAGTGEYQGTEVSGINDAGDVAGEYLSSDNSVHGYERSADGTVTTFQVSPFVETVPTAINSAGQITGFYAAGKGTAGFVWGN